MKKQNIRTLALVVLTFTYLLIGAAIFDNLESENERQEKALLFDQLSAFQRRFNISQSEMLNVSKVIVKFVPHQAGIQWKFAGSFYFALTVLTTIGSIGVFQNVTPDGHAHPNSVMASNQPQPSLNYQETLMCGQYKEDLAAASKREAERLKLQREQQQQQRRQEAEASKDPSAASPDPPAADVDADAAAKKDSFTPLDFWTGLVAIAHRFRMFFFRYVGEDWFFLVLLGVTMSLVSFAIDWCIVFCHRAHSWVYEELHSHSAYLQYTVWILFTVVFILFSTGFTHIVSPNAIGSGIPEMKTIFRGVILTEYLTFRTFVAKSIGIITALGSGLPLGKEGPFVHISSIVASLLGKCMSKKGVYENESKQSAMMGAAVAVGVGCSFAAPIGGVLFAIEVTSTLFATANYWRGFFAAVVSAAVFRLMDVWIGHELTVTALLRTTYRLDLPFFPSEFLAYVFVGAVCGLGGAFFVYSHRRWVLFMRGNKRLNKFLQKNRFIYPFVVATIIAALSCPLGPGRYFAGKLTQGAAVKQLFCNFTWTGAGSDPDVREQVVLENWQLRPGDSGSVFITLVIFIFMQFWMSIVAITLPVPAGAFIPVFTLGAAIGRLVGEALATWFPDGIHHDHPMPIIPGSYAVVGAAAFAGAATHTISTTVIVSELTGQINHILPLAFAVLTANFVAKSLDLNIFDSIIRIKKLPYLPDISTSDHTAFNIFVDDFMVKDVKYVSYTDSKYSEIKNLLEKTKLRSCPLVDSHQHMVLLGSVQRAELQLVLDRQIGRERRMREPQHDLDKVSISSRLTSRRNSSVIETMPNLAGLEQVKEQLRAIAHMNQTWSPGESLGVPQSAPPTLRVQPGWDAKPGKSILKRTTSESSERSRLGRSDAEDDDDDEGEVAAKHDEVFESMSDSELETKKSPKPSSSSSSSSAKQHGGATSPNPFSQVFQPPGASREDLHKERSVRTGLENVAHMIRAPFAKSSSSISGQRVIDLPPEEQKAWEDRQLEKIVNFNGCIIDPAPFQLVSHTSLHKVHSLFSLLSLKQAYVTNIGHLVGVVGLVELRHIIEGTTDGTAKPKPFVTDDDDDEGGDDVGLDMYDDDDDDEEFDEDDDDEDDDGGFMDLGPSEFEYGSDRLHDVDQKIRASRAVMRNAVAAASAAGAASAGDAAGGAGGATELEGDERTPGKIPGSRFRKFVVSEAAASTAAAAAVAAAVTTTTATRRRDDDDDDDDGKSCVRDTIV